MNIRTRGWGHLVAGFIISAGLACSSSGGSPSGGHGGSIGTGTGGGNGTGTGGGNGTGTGGSGNNGGGTPFSTTVPAGTKLTSLTSAQAQQLCNSLDVYTAETLGPALCKELGLESAVFLGAFASSPPSDSDLRAACMQGYNDCLNPDGGTTTTSCDPTTFMGEPSTCQATVGDLTTCANDQGSAYQQASAAIPSCGSLTAASLAAFASNDAGTTGPAEPASCAQFDSTCNTMMSP